MLSIFLKLFSFNSDKCLIILKDDLRTNAILIILSPSCKSRLTAFHITFQLINSCIKATIYKLKMIKTIYLMISELFTE